MFHKKILLNCIIRGSSMNYETLVSGLLIPEESQKLFTPCCLKDWGLMYEKGNLENDINIIPCKIIVKVKNKIIKM